MRSVWASAISDIQSHIYLHPPSPQSGSIMCCLHLFFLFVSYLISHSPLIAWAYYRWKTLEEPHGTNLINHSPFSSWLSGFNGWYSCLDCRLSCGAAKWGVILSVGPVGSFACQTFLGQITCVKHVNPWNKYPHTKAAAVQRPSGFVAYTPWSKRSLLLITTTMQSICRRSTYHMSGKSGK